jgi:hypothetical protein
MSADTKAGPPSHVPVVFSAESGDAGMPIATATSLAQKLLPPGLPNVVSRTLRKPAMTVTELFFQGHEPVMTVTDFFYFDHDADDTH